MRESTIVSARASGARLAGRAGGLRVRRGLEGFDLSIVLMIADWRRNAPESRDLLTSLMGECRGHRLTLLVTERDVEATHDVAMRPGAWTFEVGGLRPADRRALIVSLLGDAGPAAHAWLGLRGSDLPFGSCATAR